MCNTVHLQSECSHIPSIMLPAEPTIILPTEPTIMLPTKPTVMLSLEPTVMLSKETNIMLTLDPTIKHPKMLTFMLHKSFIPVLLFYLPCSLAHMLSSAPASVTVSPPLPLSPCLCVYLSLRQSLSLPLSLMSSDHCSTLNEVVYPSQILLNAGVMSHQSTSHLPVSMITDWR